jgi:hypothetical protein
MIVVKIWCRQISFVIATGNVDFASCSSTKLSANAVYVL